MRTARPSPPRSVAATPLILALATLLAFFLINYPDGQFSIFTIIRQSGSCPFPDLAVFRNIMGICGTLYINLDLHHQ